MTPAEKRVKELIDRWLTSLDLHLQYVELNDSAYNKVQPWPIHDRPTRWVLEHAKQKALELKAAFESRLGMGDAKFAESAELIVFLANLVGLQHVQRYVPLADPDRHGQATLTELDGLKPVAAKSNAEPAAPPRPAAPHPAPSAPLAPKAVAAAAPVLTPPPVPPPKPIPRVAIEDDATREMPRPKAAPVSIATPAAPSAPKPAATSEPKKALNAPPPQPAKGGPLTEGQKVVVDDAVRLMTWGRPWHELAEAIARIADRPKVAEVRRILRSHRAAIEARASSADEESAKEK